MFNTGLALQQEKKSNVLYNVHLLIVTDSSSCLDEIKQVLQAMTVKFHYHNVACDRSIEALSQHQYDLILYNYSKYQNDFDKTDPNSVLEQSETVEYLETLNGHNNPYPIPELAWWYKLSAKIPLILITEPLGDETAIACVRSGIDAYLLKNNIASLPQIIEQTLADFIAEQSYNSRQTQLRQELIKLQNENTELITAENNSDRASAALRDREYFSHLNHELRSPLASILQFARDAKRGNLWLSQPQTDRIYLLVF